MRDGEQTACLLACWRGAQSDFLICTVVEEEELGAFLKKKKETKKTTSTTTTTITEGTVGNHKTPTPQQKPSSQSGLTKTLANTRARMRTQAHTLVTSVSRFIFVLFFVFLAVFSFLHLDALISSHLRRFATSFRKRE